MWDESFGRVGCKRTGPPEETSKITLVLSAQATEAIATHGLDA